jgi:hypothetical protein
MKAMRYYEDRWSGKIYSLVELCQLVGRGDVPRYQIPRRFRMLPTAACRVLYQAEIIAAEVDPDRDQLRA